MRYPGSPVVVCGLVSLAAAWLAVSAETQAQPATQAPGSAARDLFVTVGKSLVVDAPTAAGGNATKVILRRKGNSCFR